MEQGANWMVGAGRCMAGAGRRGADMKRDDTLNVTSKPVAQEAAPQQDDTRRETVADREVDPNVKNADRPKGIDKPDGALESLNDDLQRVEKRTTM